MTILDNFKENISKMPVIEALKLLDEYIVDKDIDLSLEKEILDFGDFFVDTYEDETYDDRIKEFGEEDAIILRIYDCIVEKVNEESDFFENCEKILTSINRVEQQELEKIYEDITFLPGTKNLYFEYLDGFRFSCEIEDNLTNEQALELKGVIAKAIVSEAVLLIELTDEKIVTAMLFKNGETKAINKIGVKKIHSIDPYTGAKVKQKGFTYIDANNLMKKLIENG